jgi:prepilin-type N-terminal cleavage/methylation domain-containing protein
MIRQRKGFSLVEVMVAMTLLSIVLMSLAKIGVSVATRGRVNALVTKRNAALQIESNKLATMPFDSLANWSTSTTTFTRGGFTYSRRTTITRISSSRYTIKVVVTPSTSTTRKDSVIFDRTKPPTGSPLCVGC